jgi:dienelactone hydrolase
MPAGIEMTTGSIDSSTGCRLDYRVYDTRETDRADLVVLAHGFLRSQERMQGLAATLAASGMRVATLDFCNPRPWDGRHAQNALDMIALARALDAERVVYAGFSAGGLAAVIAGRADARAIGIVTLDLVETQGLGVRAAKGLHKPLLALAGDPTNCNALDNGRAVIAATDWARVQRIDGAGHCDFEAPTDQLCELLCSDPDSGLRSGRQRAEFIRARPARTDHRQHQAGCTLVVRRRHAGVAGASRARSARRHRPIDAATAPNNPA